MARKILSSRKGRGRGNDCWPRSRNQQQRRQLLPPRMISSNFTPPKRRQPPALPGVTLRPGFNLESHQPCRYHQTPGRAGGCRPPLLRNVPHQQHSTTLLESCVAYLPWLWLIGTPLTFALLVSGVVGTRRLGRSSHAIDSDPIVELLAHLASSLRITRRVTVAVCDRIASPVLIGIIRPMILLPPAAITGWSPDEIEMVLLHELAHVRRWDNLVNLLQRCVESLLFFHPAVWLISNLGPPRTRSLLRCHGRRPHESPSRVRRIARRPRRATPTQRAVPPGRNLRDGRRPTPLAHSPNPEIGGGSDARLRKVIGIDAWQPARGRHTDCALRASHWSCGYNRER